MTNDSDDVRATTRLLLALVNDDPVQATIDCSFALQQLERQRQEDLNHLVVVPYATALHLLTDWNAWCTYINTPLLWAHRTRKRPRRDKDRGRVLYLVMEATFAGELGRNYQAGWWYARALEDAFIRGIKPADLPEHIKSCGSLKQMYESAVKNNPKRKPGRDEDDRYFELSDPKLESTDSSQDEAQKRTDPTLHPDTRAHDAHSGSEDSNRHKIRHSPRLAQELNKIARNGCPKRLVVIARPSGDQVILRLPKKSPTKPSASSSWRNINIQPNHSDTYYGPLHYDTTMPQITSNNWTTYKP